MFIHLKFIEFRSDDAEGNSQWLDVVLFLNGSVKSMCLSFRSTNGVADAAKNRIAKFVFDAGILFRCVADALFDSFGQRLVQRLVRLPQLLRLRKIQNHHDRGVAKGERTIDRSMGKEETNAMLSGVKTTSISLVKNVPSPNSHR